MENQSETPNEKQLRIQDIIREIEQKSEGGISAAHRFSTCA